MEDVDARGVIGAETGDHRSLAWRGVVLRKSPSNSHLQLPKALNSQVDRL